MYMHQIVRDMTRTLIVSYRPKCGLSSTQYIVFLVSIYRVFLQIIQYVVWSDL